jgi:hypothetical protein
MQSKNRKLIKINISNEEDYEFYPTTNEIIEALYDDIVGKEITAKDIELSESGRVRGEKSISLLDIGAGNCKIYFKLEEISRDKELLPEYVNEPIIDRWFFEKLSIQEIIKKSLYFALFLIFA